MKKAFLLFLCVLALVGCQPRIMEGEVYCKKYLPASSNVRMLTLPVVIGDTITTILIPQKIYHPERWLLYIRRNTTDGWSYEEFYVSKSVFDSFCIGDWFVYSPDRGDSTTEPKTKSPALINRAFFADLKI